MIATYQRFSGSGVFVMDILECAYKLPKSILQPISKLQCDYEQQLAFLKEELEEQKLENKRLREQL